MVIAALLHDIGDELAPCSHSELAAAVLELYERVRFGGEKPEAAEIRSLSARLRALALNREEAA